MNNSIIKFLFIFLLSLAVSTQGSQILQRKYDKIVRRLEFARDIEITYPNASARTLISEAETMLLEAQTLQARQRILIANRRLERAEDIINKATRMILESPLHAQKKKLNALLQRANSDVPQSGNQKAGQVLQQSKDHEQKAIDAFRENDFQMAMQNMRLAIFFANKSLEILENQNTNVREKIDDEKQRLVVLRNRASELVAGSDNHTAKKLFKSAERQVDKIKQNLSENNYTQAIRHYHQATRLYLRIIDITSSNSNKLAIRTNEEIIALDELVESLQNSIPEAMIQENPRIALLFDRILEFQQKAHDALELKEYDNVSFNCQMAQNLVERILKFSNNPDVDSNEQKMDEDIDQLRIDLEEISIIVSKSDNEEAKELLDYAVRAKERAEILLEKGRKSLAAGAIAISNRLAFIAEQIAVDPSSIIIDKQTVATQMDKVKNRISKIQERQNKLTPKDALLLTEAEKIYAVTVHAYEKGFYIFASEGLQIIERYLTNIL